MTSKNGATRPRKQKPEFISREEVARVLGVTKDQVTKEHVVAALTFTVTFDSIVGDLFSEDWFARYAEQGEKRLSHIPLHGLTPGSIWADSMLIESAENGEPDNDGMMFVQGFATAFAAMVRWHKARLMS